MPPVGLEIISPMLRTLSDDSLEIKELLPKIVDIESEVYNETDTIRNMKMDLGQIKNKFNKAEKGIIRHYKNKFNKAVEGMIRHYNE